MVDANSEGARGPAGSPDGQDPGAGAAVAPEVRQLVHEHYSTIYRYAYRLTGKSQDAEDLTQQTFLVAQRKLGQLRCPDKADRWLGVILRNLFLKTCRQRRPLPVSNLELDVDQLADPALPLQHGAIDREELQQGLNALPDTFRLIVLMFYFEDFSYKEIAAELEIPMGTVMSRLSRAKAHLRKWLQERQAQSGSEAAPRTSSGSPRMAGSTPQWPGNP